MEKTKSSPQPQNQKSFELFWSNAAILWVTKNDKE